MNSPYVKRYGFTHIVRDAMTAATWFDGPASGPAMVYRDRRELIEAYAKVRAENERLRDIMRVGWIPYSKEHGGFDAAAFEMSEDKSGWTLGDGWEWVEVFAELPAEPPEPT